MELENKSYNLNRYRFYRKNSLNLWVPYDENNQQNIHQYYILWIYDQLFKIVPLKEPFNDYIIDFKESKEYFQNDKNINSSIKVIDIKNVSNTNLDYEIIEDLQLLNLFFINNEKNELNKEAYQDKNKIPNNDLIMNYNTPKIDFLFCFQSNPNPWNSQEKPTFTPYKLEDQLNIQEICQISNQREIPLINSEYYLKIKSHDCIVQYKKFNEYNLRSVHLLDSKTEENIIRFSRQNFQVENFNSHKYINNFIEIIKIEQEFDEFQDIIDKFPTQSFRKINKITYTITPDIEIKLEIEDQLNLFKNPEIIKSTLGDMKSKIVDEIYRLGEGLGGNFSKSTSKYISEIIEINNPIDFYRQIIKIFSFEGFLSEKINEYLRFFNLNELKKIRYYYISLLASIQYIRTYENKNNIQQENLTIYWVSNISEKEFKEFENKKQNSFMIIFYEFISSSFNSEVAFNYINKTNFEKIQIFWEMKIPNNLIKFEPSNFADISDLSIFKNEYEILLRSGAVIRIDKIEKLTDNQNSVYFNKYKFECSLMSFSCLQLYKFPQFNSNIDKLSIVKSSEKNLKNYMIYAEVAIKNHYSIDTLNLYGNNLGESDECMEILKDIVINTDHLKNLDLMKNDLGRNEKNMLFLKEIGMKNRSIKSLQLAENNLGCNSKNLKLLNEILEINKSINILFLRDNDINKEDIQELVRNNPNIEIDN